MTKIIAVSNHKGGVGKTTSTVNLGAALASKGYKVCLVDLDPQANLTQSFFRTIDAETETIYDYLKDETTTPRMVGIYDYLEKTATTRSMILNQKLFVVPSCLDLAAAEGELISEPGREYLLKNVIDEILDKYEALNIGYVLIDCPPSLGLLTLNALTAAHEVLIPLQAEYLPFSGLVRLRDTIIKVKTRINPQLEIGGVFLTQFDPRKILNKNVKESAGHFFKDKLLTTTISTNIALAEAPSRNQDIFSYDSNCKGALDYMALCEEILEREGLNGKEKL